MYLYYRSYMQPFQIRHRNDAYLRNMILLLSHEYGIQGMNVSSFSFQDTHIVTENGHSFEAAPGGELLNCSVAHC